MHLAYKFNSELAYELPLPASVLASIDYPHSFPAPPDLDKPFETHENLELQRQTWYYYLAEIANRHLLDRILESQRDALGLPMTQYVTQLLKDVRIFEFELSDWHASLPPNLTFPMPSKPIGPLANELSQHLRGRFMMALELMYRPFVRICISQNLEIGSELLGQVTTVASQGLQYCVLRIQAIGKVCHHGLWFQLRNFASFALILSAASKACSNPALNAPPMLDLPQDWRSVIIQKKSYLAVHWSDSKGGTLELGKLIDWALDDSL